MNRSEKQKYLVITFHTTAEVMRLEKAAKITGLPGKIIQVPRQLSAGCGLAWKSSLQHMEKTKELLSQNKIEVEKIHEIYI